MRRQIPVTFILAGLIALCAMLLPAAASAVLPTGIKGQVTDSGTHEPISGAKVCVTPGGGGLETCESTNHNGEFEIQGLKEEEYKVEFTAPNHEPEVRGVKVESEKLAVANAELQEVGQGSVTGLVTNASTGQGAGGVEVCSNEFKGHCTETKGNGEYTLTGLSVGSHEINFSPAETCEEEQGEKTDRCNLNSNYLGQQPSVQVKVSPTATLDVALQVGGQISGTVTNASITHPGLAKIRVCATRVQGTAHIYEEEEGESCAVTGSNGQYTISGLASGVYKVEFNGVICSILKPKERECVEAYVTRFYPGQQTHMQAKSIPVTTGSNTGGINESLYEAFPATPAVTAAPALTGAALVGSALTCSQGSWSHEPTYLLYQWLRSGTVIAGQTGSTYTLQTADLGSSITCSVTAGNGAGAVSATSNAIAVPKPIAVAVGTASVKGNVAMLKLTCTGAAACAGTLKLLAPVRHGRRTTNVTVGTARFSIAVGKSATLHVRLTAKGRSLVGKAARRGLRVKLSGSGVKGRTLVLKAVQAKKGRRK
jgi:hypothetical protein